ncbi:MAG: CocE/NonD family hydrolase, partial [Waddliaceae bacterium]
PFLMFSSRMEMRIVLLASFFTLVFHHIRGEELNPSLTVPIPMRDGTKLLADLYFPPEGEPSDCPCVLLRCPAGRKAPFAVKYTALAACGYVVAIQDTRSAIDQEGKTFPYWSDGWGREKDGYDTIEWLSKSSYSNGKIGTVGVSALGITQLMLAPTAPPSLKCQHIGVAAGSLYHHALYPGGQILKDQVEGWLQMQSRDSGVHSYACSHLFYNDFWERFNTIRVADRVAVPAIHFGGWYDTFLQGTIDSYVSRQERGREGAKGQQKMVIGPWTHFWPEINRLGEFEVPAAGVVPPTDFSPKPWLDYHLKGLKNGIEEMSPVTYYVMGPFDGSPSTGNVWRFADKWPIPCVDTSFYLSSDQKLLENEKPVASKTFFFKYDPYNPAPTIGGRNLFLASGPMDQRPIEQRDDVLVFTSAPLSEDIEVTGNVVAKLFFSSNCEDTDVVVRLTDVYPDGKSILIADGIYRTGMGMIEKEHNAHKPVEIDVDLWSTSIVFARGHRIRISIAGSNYPKYEKNFNVGFIGAHSGAYAIAKNKIYIGGPHLSRLILPVVRRGG